MRGGGSVIEMPRQSIRILRLLHTKVIVVGCSGQLKETVARTAGVEHVDQQNRFLGLEIDVI